MEASMAFSLEYEDTALCKFIHSMWDIDTKPLDTEDAGDYAQAYECLEFIEEPQLYRNETEHLLLGYIDVITNNDPWDELADTILPYIETGAKQALVMISGDEGDYWFLIDGKRKIKEIKVRKKWFAQNQNGDAFLDLVAVLKHLKK